ncbi:MAG: AraC family transcriptional regulator [Planctomycetota bacterium]|nr:MAG: AraC family transcriptional regulator [Planctomycetota bacterium]
MIDLMLSLMLYYFAHGSRDYQREPITIRKRAHWECAAILRGRARATTPDGSTLCETPALWIFPPAHAHGWQASSGSGCQVLVAHLPHLPRLLADLAEAHGFLRIPLSRPAAAHLKHCGKVVSELLHHQPGARDAAADLIRGHTAAIALRQQPAPTSSSGHSDDQQRRIKRALAWLQAHLHDPQCHIADAAQAVGLSPAHLRRLAHEVSGSSPRHLLSQLRLQRACDLLRQTGDSLETIAAGCGYTSAVGLSNAFLRRYGQRPGQWRRGGG